MRLTSIFSALALALGLLTFPHAAQAQRAYGVNSQGLLFQFDVNTPQNVIEVGNIGFVPEGIDFRPGTSDLYAIEIGANTSQLYTINVATGTASAVGAGFNSTGNVNGVDYSLVGSNTFGFDFNPKTLQADQSMRIRLVATSGANLRLNSSTGQIAGVDGNLAFGGGDSAFVDGAAYINNIPQAGGTTALYDMDSRNDALLLQNPPNNGTLTTVGAFGVTIDADRNIGFDIYTTPGDADPTIGGDFGYAVLTRQDAPINGPLGAYLLYNVNLGTGQITNGALVGPQQSPYDFVGGFAVAPIPEPSTLVFGALAATGCGVVLWKRKRAS